MITDLVECGYMPPWKEWFFHVHLTGQFHGIVQWDDSYEGHSKTGISGSSSSFYIRSGTYYLVLP
jgi:hypothetical protein